MMKKWQIMLLMILAVIAVLLILFHKLVWLIGCNLFQPALPLDENAEWTGGTYNRVYYGESEAQYADLYVPNTDEPSPLFVLVHGGGFVSNDAQSRQAQFMYRYFRDHGYACASVNYRLAAEAPFPAAIEDVGAAVKYLGQHAGEFGYNAEKVAIWGESAGGYLAAYEAISETEVNIAALVDFYGCTDFLTMEEQFEALGIPKLVRTIANSWAVGALEGFSSCEEYWLRKPYAEWSEELKKTASVVWQAEHNAKNPSLRSLIYHGDADMTVPDAQSAALFSALKHACGEGNVKYERFHGYMHAADRFYSDERLSEVESFIREVIK